MFAKAWNTGSYANHMREHCKYSQTCLIRPPFVKELWSDKIGGKIEQVQYMCSHIVALLGRLASYHSDLIRQVLCIVYF